MTYDEESAGGEARRLNDNLADAKQREAGSVYGDHRPWLQFQRAESHFVACQDGDDGHGDCHERGRATADLTGADRCQSGGRATIECDLVPRGCLWRPMVRHAVQVILRES